MNINKYSNIFRFLLWSIFSITFVSEFVKIVFERNPQFGHRPLQMANATGHSFPRPTEGYLILTRNVSNGCAALSRRPILP